MFKNHITTVSPFPLVAKKHIVSLTSLADHRIEGETVVIPNRFGAVPIYQDKVKFVDFTSAISQPGDKDAQKSKENGPTDSNNDNATEIRDYKISNYIDFGSYELKNPAEKLFNVGIVGFKNLADQVIEQVLNLLINESDNLLPKSVYQWSYVDDLDNKVVFFKLLKDEANSALRLDKLLKLKAIQIFDGELMFSPSSGLRQYLKDALGDKENLEVPTDDIQGKVNNLIKSNGDKTPEKSGSSDYAIDETQLKDIPADVLPQVKKDIKDFRLKVIEIEQRKRIKEKQEEIRRSKAQLRKLFENSKKGDGSSTMDVDEGDEDDDEEEDNGLSDEQFEELRQQREKTAMMRNYTIKLATVRAIERYNKELVELAENLRNYESMLDKITRPEYEKGVFKPSGVLRETEAAKDAKDREEEGKEIPATTHTEPVQQNINISLKAKPETEAATGHVSGDIVTDIDVSEEILSKALADIRSKIDSYLEDLLGVADEDLTNYIIMVIQDTKSKGKLIEELRETFDEDAEKISESIWKDLLGVL